MSITKAQLAAENAALRMQLSQRNADLERTEQLCIEMASRYSAATTRIDVLEARFHARARVGGQATHRPAHMEAARQMAMKTGHCVAVVHDEDFDARR